MAEAETKPALSSPEDDSDINDLLGDKPSSDDKEDEKKSLKSAMDKLSSSDQNEDLIRLLPSKTALFNVCELIFAYISLFVLNRPKVSGGIVLVSLIGIIVGVNLTLKNAPDPSPEHVIEHDYSGIKSQYELSAGKVDHWCLQGGDQHCRCEDPLRPVKKKGFPAWEKAFQKNLDSIDDAFENDEEIDVVFLGENMVEYWGGRSLSFNSTFVHNVSQHFNQQFKKEGKIRGLPLGIAGDTTSNLLWRIQNGEMPYYLNPTIWWLVIGTNDLAMKQCSEEVVLMGILRIIEEILERKPDARIVVNSILPMSSDPKGRVPRITRKDRKKVHTESIGGFRRRLLGRGKRRRKKKDEEEDGIGEEGKMTTPEAEGDTSAIKGEMKPGKAAVPVIRVRRGPLRWISVSMWPSVEALNFALRKFCMKHKRVSFFDAYDIFVEDDDDNNSVPNIIKDLTKSFAIGQPSVAGHQELLKGIKQKLRDILNKLGKQGKAKKKFDDGEKSAKKEEKDAEEENKRKKIDVFDEDESNDKEESEDEGESE